MSTVNQNRAVMFIDVSDSTALYEALGDEQAHAHVRSCLAALSRVAQDFGGWVVKTTGDGLMIAFNDADAAIQAGSAMHARNAARVSTTHEMTHNAVRPQREPAGRFGGGKRCRQ